MTQESVKKKIKAKFGSYSEFARMADLDRYEFQRDFLTANRVSKADLKTYNDLCDKLDFVSKDIPQEAIQKVRDLIFDKYGTITKFCKVHPQFPEGTIFRMLSEGGARKTSRKAKELFEFFKIEI